MALRSILRKTIMSPPNRHKAWVNMLADKAKTAEDHSSVSALSAICDYYSIGIPQDEIRAKNNFEINWKDWDHIETPGLLEKLKAKVEAINGENYETEVFSHEIVSETDNLKKLQHIVTYNAVLHITFIAEKDEFLENLSHAKPFATLDYWEVSSMYKYYDLPYRTDKELGWMLPNNDQIVHDVVGTNTLQFVKDLFKSANNRYYYDYLGKHQVMCTAGKLSQIKRED